MNIVVCMHVCACVREMKWLQTVKQKLQQPMPIILGTMEESNISIQQQMLDKAVFLLINGSPVRVFFNTEMTIVGVYV